MFLLATAIVGGCGGQDASSSDEANITDGECGSALGEEVVAAALAGESTTTDIESRANRIVKGPLVDTREIGDAMFDLISSAKKEVFIEFWDIRESWLTTRMADAIASLPRTVPVFIVINRHNLTSASTLTTRLMTYFPGSNVTVAVWKKPDLFHIRRDGMHSKMIVVDGARALVTDTNLGTEYDPAAEGGLQWLGLGMVVEGSIAASLRQEAASVWSNVWEESAPFTIPEAPGETQAVGECLHMAVASRHAGAGDESSGNQALMALFSKARRHLRILNPNLNAKSAMKTLAAATADVDVYLVLSKGFNDSVEGMWFEGGTNEEVVPKLAKMAKDPSRLHIRWFAREQGVAIDGNSAGQSHAKWASADGEVMIHGSQNLDKQAWSHSREVNVIVDDAAHTERWDAMFQEIWDRSPVAFEADVDSP